MTKDERGCLKKSTCIYLWGDGEFNYSSLPTNKKNRSQDTGKRISEK